MSSEEWSFHPGRSARDPCQTQDAFVFETSVEALSRNPSAEEHALYLENISATGRRSWKRKGTKGEAIWPPELEIALLEGLKRYQNFIWKPVRDRRYPMRNRFIAEYIQEATGVRRTPRQVSSRIQQLRGTCRTDSILQLILPSDDNLSLVPSTQTPPPTLSRDPPTNPYPRLHHQRRRSPRLDSPLVDGLSNGQVEIKRDLTLDSPSTFCVEILLDKTLRSSSLPVVSLAAQSSSEPQQIRLACYDAPLTSTTTPPFYPCNTIILGLSSTVQFNSPWPLFPQSSLSVFISGSRTPIYTETTAFLCTSSLVDSAGWTYATSLVPGFWHNISNSADPTQFSIEQQIMSLRPAPCGRHPPTATNGPAAGITVYYKFCLYRSSDPPALRCQDRYNSPQVSSEVHAHEAALSEPRWSDYNPCALLRQHKDSMPFDFPGTDVQGEECPVPMHSTHQIWRPAY